MKKNAIKINTLIAAVTGLCVQSVSAQLFTESFDTAGSVNNWHVNNASANSIPDFTAEFGFDYSTQTFVRNGVTNTIPPAPNGGGNSVGVKLTANNNDATPSESGVSLYAANQDFSGHYALRFDMWLNYNGPEFGGTGSTEFATFGVNHTVTNSTTWGFGAAPASGIWFAVTGEGGAARDYRSYLGDLLFGGSLELQDPGGGFLDRDGDAANEFDIFIDDSQPVTYPLKLMFPNPAFETDGMPSKQWVQVEVRQITNEFGSLVYTWLIDGYVIAEHSNNDGQISGDVMIGYMDIFSSIANPAAQNFVIYDNLRVVDLDVVGVPPTVSIVATQPNASEPSTDGLITISRSGPTTNPLTVDFRMAGTATRGADYNTQTNGATFAGNSVIIPAGAASVDVAIDVIDDGAGEPVETAILVLAGKPGVYDVRSSLSATVEITDDGDVPTASIAVTKGFAYEPNAVNPGRLEVRFSNPAFGNVTVNLTVTGTATGGVDYVSLPTSVVINSGETNAFLTVAPINNSLIDSNRTVIVTVASGTGYTVGAPASGTVTIRDDDTLPSGTGLYSENFDTASSSNNWTVNIQSGRTDHTATFAYDYSLDGIPPAPNSSGSTLGLKLTANEAGGIGFGGLSASPSGQNFTGDYVLRFDMWINYNGPLPTGGSGSSEFGGGGVLTSGTVPEFAGSGNGIFFAAVGDGAFLQDFRVYFKGALQNIGADNVTFPGGSQNGNVAYYSIFGGEPAPAVQQAASPTDQAGLTAPGNAGFAWRDMAVVKQGTVVSLFMDNLHIATYDTTTNLVFTNICLVYWDPNTGASPLPQFSFGLFDNVRVESLAVPTAPVITSITIVSGTTVQVDFSAGASDTPANFQLHKSATVGSGYANDGSASIISLGGGNFRASTDLSGDQQYYRILRN